MNPKYLSPNFPPEKNIFLQSHTVYNTEIEICPVSGGIWFDRFELKKFDEENEPLEEILALLPKNPKPAEILTGRRSPKHPEAIMQQRPYGPKGMNGVLTVDICPVCAGIWLDFNELQKIRQLYPNEKIMQKLSTDFVNQTFKAIQKK